MEKAHRFTADAVTNIVPTSKGVYLLGTVRSKRFIVGYVGRSDSNLRQRLLSHNHREKFDYFKFQPVRTRLAGFLLETRYWYLYKNGVINQIHPNVPENIRTAHPLDVLGGFLRRKFIGGNRK